MKQNFFSNKNCTSAAVILIGTNNLFLFENTSVKFENIKDHDGKTGGQLFPH